MKIRPPVVHVFSVVMVLSLVLPAFFSTPHNSAASVSPLVIDVPQAESVAGIDPEIQSVIGPVQGDAFAIAGATDVGDPYPAERILASGTLSAKVAPARGCSQYQASSFALELKYSFDDDRNALPAGLPDLTTNWDLASVASRYATRNSNERLGDLSSVVPGSPVSASGFIISLPQVGACTSDNEVVRVRNHIYGLRYDNEFKKAGSTHIGVWAFSTSDGQWMIGVVVARYAGNTSIPNYGRIILDKTHASAGESVLVRVINAPAWEQVDIRLGPASVIWRDSYGVVTTDSAGNAQLRITLADSYYVGSHKVEGWMSTDYRKPDLTPASLFKLSTHRYVTATVNKTVVEGGSAVIVTGTGFGASEPVQIFLVGEWDAPLRTVNASRQGTFQVSVTMPRVSADTVEQLYVQGYTSNKGIYTQPIRVNKALIDRGTLRLTPATGPSGEYTAVYGTGFLPGETVQIRWGNDRGTVIGNITVRGDGTYLGRITTRTGPPGSNRVYAVGLTSNYRALAWYQITSSTPSMVLNTSHRLTSSGAVITITGSGYQPNEIVHIRWVSQSGSLLGTVRASSSGAISGRITIPQVPNKNYQIFATGASSKRYGSVVHQVRNHVRTGSTIVSPNFGMSGQVVTVTGRGYQPGERVEIRWGSVGGRLLGYVTARSDGSYYGRVTIPVANAGPYNVVTVGTSSYRYSSGPYMVTANTTRSQLNVSHVNVRPGYVIMANGTGWTPGQRLELRWNGAKGQVLGYVTVRANGTWSGRVTIPTTSKPGTYYLVASTPSGFTSVRINVSGTSIASMPIGFIEDVATEEADTPAPEMIGTPMASPTVVPTEEAPVGTPGVVPDEELVGTPSAEPTEEPVDEIPDGTPTTEPTEEPVDEIPDSTPSPDGDDGSTEEVDDVTEDEGDEEPVPVLHAVTFVVVDQHGAPVTDVCVEVTNLVTGEVVHVCDATHDGVSDGRISLPVVEEGSYRIAVKNLPADVNAITPKEHFLDGTEVRITVERQPPPPEATEPPVVEEPESGPEEGEVDDATRPDVEIEVAPGTGTPESGTVSN